MTAKLVPGVIKGFAIDSSEGRLTPLLGSDAEIPDARSFPINMRLSKWFMVTISECLANRRNMHKSTLTHEVLKISSIYAS